MPMFLANFHLSTFSFLIKNRRRTDLTKMSGCADDQQILNPRKYLEWVA